MRLTNLLFTTLLLFVSVFARSQKSNEFTVLQWNVWQEGTMVPGGYDAIVNEIVRLKPDFVTLGKSIAGGVPIAVYGFTKEVADKIALQLIQE